MNTQLHSIDFETWERRQYFYYFTEMLPTGFNLNVEIDITETYHQIKD
jgi:chloramphenicol O-acetyltransferase type A